jgi:hypothetical protein
MGSIPYEYVNCVSLKRMNNYFIGNACDPLYFTPFQVEWRGTTLWSRLYITYLMLTHHLKFLNDLTPHTPLDVIKKKKKKKKSRP